MAQNKVMKLWTTIVTAFLALFTALGLVTATTATAAQETEAPTNSSDSSGSAERAVQAPAPMLLPWSWIRAGALPPTMKQRIRAEAHGKSPSCRHRSLTDTETDSAERPEANAPLNC